MIKEQITPEFDNLRHRIIELEQYKIKCEQLETALQKSESQYYSLFNLVPYSVVTMNMKGIITSINKTTPIVSGWTEDDLIGKHFTKVGALRARDIPKYVKMFRDAMKGEIPESFECIFYKKSGEIGHVEIHASLLEVGGKKVAFQIFLNDLTKRKNAETMLEKQSFAIETSMDGISLTNERGEFIYVNDAYAKMYGYDHPEELIGKNWRIHSDKGVTERFKKKIVHFLFKNGKWHGEVLGRKRDGTIFPVELSINLNEQGWSTCVARDITERKRVEKRIEQRLVIDRAIAKASKILISPRDSNLNEVLRILGEAVSVNRSYIFQFRENNRKLDNTYE